MIPEFPAFKKLELSDKAEIGLLVDRAELPDYSDFHFVNLWIWSTAKNTLVSRFHNNLAVIFNDYVSGRPFLSFVGKNNIRETATELIRFSKEYYQTPCLKLIPEEIATNLSEQGFTVEPDESSHDYIYAVPRLADMNNWPKNTKSRKIRRFIKDHPGYAVRHIAIGEDSTKELKGLFQKWGKNKRMADILDSNEYQAFGKLLQLKDHNLKAVLLHAEGVLRGFTVYEHVPASACAISRFAKADTQFNSAIYDILNWEEAKILEEAGIKYYNWEQDLGIEGLRYSKRKYQPAFFRRKYDVFT